MLAIGNDKITKIYNRNNLILEDRRSNDTIYEKEILE